MSKFTYRPLFIFFFALVGIAFQQLAASAQESEREGAERRSARSTNRPSGVFNPLPGQRATFAQFGAGRGNQPNPDEPRSDEPRDMIAFTVWDVTISDSAGPESDELVGRLVDKANNLPR